MQKCVRYFFHKTLNYFENLNLLKPSDSKKIAKNVRESTDSEQNLGRTTQMLLEILNSAFR